MSEPYVAVVLDVTSMLAFARGDARVAEIIVETAAQGAVVGVPVVALLAAHVAVRSDPPARARLGLLGVLPAVRVLAMTAHQAGSAAAAVAGSTDLAGIHAAWACAEHNAYYVTTDPARAPAQLESWQVYPLVTAGVG